MTFDVTYNLLRRRTLENRQWGLGIFSGFGSNLEPVVFGYCLVSRETKESFMRLFQNVFEMLGHGYRVFQQFLLSYVKGLRM
jgi:hypothetical protein